MAKPNYKYKCFFMGELRKVEFDLIWKAWRKEMGLLVPSGLLPWGYHFIYMLIQIDQKATMAVSLVDFFSVGMMIFLSTGLFMIGAPMIWIWQTSVTFNYKCAMLTILNCLYMAFDTGSEGLTFDLTTWAIILPTVTMPNMSL